MIHALISGSLYGDPQQRTGKSGKPFTTAKLKTAGKDGQPIWVNLIAFNDVGDQLAALSANAPLSVTGQAEISAWIGKDGNPAAGLSLTIEEMIGLKQKSPKKRSTATVFDDAFDDLVKDVAVA